MNQEALERVDREKLVSFSAVAYTSDVIPLPPMPMKLRPHFAF